MHLIPNTGVINLNKVDSFNLPNNNMFVAEYLLDTDETMQVLTEQNSFFVTASILEVPPEILDFKWRMLKYYGYLSGQSPISVGSDCLKKMQVGGAGCDQCNY